MGLFGITIAGPKYRGVYVLPEAVAQLRARFNGVDAELIQRGHEEIDVVVSYPEERRQSLRELSGLRIKLPDGSGMPLSLAVTLTGRQEPAELKRINGHATAFVDAKLDLAVNMPRQVRKLLRQDIIPELEAASPGLRIARDGKARAIDRILDMLMITFPIALLAMYGIMAAFLRSYWKPLVAVAGVPVTFAGAVLAHWHQWPEFWSGAVCRPALHRYGVTLRKSF